MIATSPLTGRIFSGRVNRAGNAFVGEKKDVTSEVLGALIQKAEFHGGSFEVHGSDGKSWTVTVATGGKSSVLIPGYVYDRRGKEPCGECHIQPGETCDICGAAATGKKEGG